MTDVAKELAERIAEEFGKHFDNEYRKAEYFSTQMRNKLAELIASALQPQWVSVGASRIALERQRQVESEGWTPEHDDEHLFGDMAVAAIFYAAPKSVYSAVTKYIPWPWDVKWLKREKHSRIRQLEIAGALIAAEIDRLIRVLPAPPTEQNERAEKSAVSNG